MATETVTIHITAATRNPRGENTNVEINMDEALCLLQIMHTGVVRTSLCADLALSLALTCLINTLVGALVVLLWHRVVASQHCSQWDGLAGVVPLHWVGQCLCHLAVETIARS
jgi:hypothetical protein